MKYSILNWNTALSESKGKDNSEAIFKYIKEFLQKTNSIAILQQIPYKDNTTWEESKLYKSFNNEFPKEEYKLFMNNEYNKNALMLTVAVTNLKDVECSGKDEEANNRALNREVGITINVTENSRTSVLGVHAHGENKSANISYLKKIPDYYDIIVGDFNAGDYDKSENSDVFRSILTSHVCICNIPTKECNDRKTCIDHVFIKRNLVTKCSNLIVHDNVKLSDHYPITFCVDL